LNRWDDVVVVVLGSTNTFQDLPNSPLQLAATALEHGGGVLVASDSQTWFTNFPNGNDVRGRVHIPQGSVSGGNRTNPQSLFLGKNSMPFVVPADPPPGSAAPEWHLFDGLDRIATNKPAFIRVPVPKGEFHSLLAGYPDDCIYFDNDQQIGGGVGGSRIHFAVGGSSRRNDPWQHRFLVLADPSVFINQMMLASDDRGSVDNLEFGARVVTYLAERSDGARRTRCLLIQNGVVVDDYSTLRRMMQPPLPLPSFDKKALQEKLTDLGNKIVDDMEENDRANSILLGKDEEKRNERFKDVMKGVFALLLIRAVWYLLKRSWASKRPADGAPPPPGGLPQASMAQKPRGLFDRRQRELFRRNNVYEPARLITREMFIAAGAPEDPGKKLPEVEISDAVSRPDTLVDALTDLWKIAFGPPRVLTVQRWKLLEPLLERVRQAHADGKWRLVPAS
jgi:hypothetical protein